MQLLTYEDKELMQRMRAALRLQLNPGEMLIYRDAFRWKDDRNDWVLPSHYECNSIESLASEFEYDIVHNFNHLAIVRQR